MSRKTLFLTLVLSGLLLLSLAPLSLAAQGASPGGLPGTWKITHRPVNAAGVPCPFLPESIQFFKDGSLVMSNFPGAHLPFRTEFTPAELQALEKRSEGFKGKHLLLVKPNPKMEWSATPMAYVYALDQDELKLTAQGWEPATYQRQK